MSRRRRRQYEEMEEQVELEQVLQPDQQWAEDAWQDSSGQFYTDGYDEYMEEDYSHAHEAADSESRFRIAMGVFDLVSILVGIGVILLLVALLFTLFNWLRNDILHSALLLQSGLQ